MTELKTVIDDIKQMSIKQESKISSIKRNQDIHMWISGLMPIIAEPLRNIFMNLLNNLKGNMNLISFEQFQAHTNPLIKDMPEDVKTLVNSSAFSFYQNQNSGSNPSNSKGIAPK